MSKQHVTPLSRREYLNAWRKRKRANDELSTPMPESKLRRRVCRVCTLPVEAKSYWYCNNHNVLACAGDDNIVYSAHDINVESY